MYRSLRSKIEDSCKASFMEFSIEVHYSKFTIEFFDKRDGFPFISIACHIWIVICHLQCCWFIR